MSPEAVVKQEEYLLLNRFNLLEVLSADLPHPVYVASDEKNRTTLRSLVVLVALKVFENSDEIKTAWLQEEVARSNLFAHPHVAQLYELAQTGDFALLTMEYVPGLSLELCAEKLFFSPSHIHALALQLFSAIEFLHGIHQPIGTITGRRVLVRDDGTLKLLCWGTSRKEQGGSEELRQAASLLLELFRDEMKLLCDSEAAALREELQVLFSSLCEDPASYTASLIMGELRRMQESHSVSVGMNEGAVSLLEEALQQTNTILTTRGVTVLLGFLLIVCIFFIFLAHFGEMICIDFLGMRISTLSG